MMKTINVLAAAFLTVWSGVSAAADDEAVVVEAGNLEVFSDFAAFVDGVSDLGPLTEEDFDDGFTQFIPGTEFSSCVEPVTSNSSDACFGPGDLVEGISITSSETYGVVVLNDRVTDAGSPAIAAWPYRINPPEDSLNFTTVTFDAPVLAVAADVFGFKLDGGVPTGDPVPVVVEAFAPDGTSIGSLTVNPPDYDESVFVGVRSTVPVARIEYGTRTQIAGEMIDNLFFNGGPADIVATPASVDFGPLSPGNSVTTSVTLTNIGYQAGVIDTVSVPDAPYSVVSDGCSGVSLDAGATCELDLMFAPDHAGVFEDEVSVSTGDTDLGIGLAGQGARARLSVRPERVDFGAISVGDTAPAITVTLGNERAVPLEVTGIGSVQTPFVFAGGTCAAPPFLLQPGTACELDYTFSPADPGVHATTVVLETNGNPAGRVLRLNGEGAETTATQAASNGE